MNIRRDENIANMEANLTYYYGDLFIRSEGSRSGSQPWKPDNYDVKFLGQQILVQSSLSKIQQADATCYSATFFKDFPDFQRTVSVWLYSKKSAWEKNRENNKWLLYEGRPVVVVLNRNDHGISDDITKTISYALRNSATLSKEMAIRASNALVFADKGGIGAYFCKTSSTAQFERILICQMLVMAYADVLEDSVQNLAAYSKDRNSPGGYEKLILAYEKLLEFITSSYTSYPVRRHVNDLFIVYEKLKDHYRLDEIQQEIQRQILSLSQFLQAEQSRQMLERQTQLMHQNAQRSAAEAEERKKAELERQKAERHRAGSERREKFLNVVVSITGLIISGMSVPEEIRDYMINVVTDIKTAIGF